MGAPPTGESVKAAYRDLNEFYKKGCQEKTRPRPEWRLFLEIQPHCSFTSLERFGLISILVSFSARVTMLSSWRERQARRVASEATMVLSEARGLWLFLVIRGGITCNG